MNNKVKKIVFVIVAALLFATFTVALVACNRTDTVTYVYGNDKQADMTVEIFDGKVQSLRAPESKDGYTFAYWALEGEDEPFDFAGRTVEGSVKIIAVWDPNVTFAMEDVVEYLFEGERPSHVKKGEEISFRVNYKEGFSATGAQICANGTQLTPNAEGVYTYTVQEPTQFTVTGGARQYEIAWRPGDGASFVYIGTSTAPRRLTQGTQVTFGVRVSPYYNGEPVVRAYDRILEPKNGNYTFTVTGDTIVTVSGLTADQTDPTGIGTSNDPYVITTPAQLKQITDDINSSSGSDLSDYADAYIRLDADLDLKGETLEPIGRYSGTDPIPFMGVFDGNGHTISNYKLSYDVDNGGSVSGLFAMLGPGAAIYDLTLNAELEFGTMDAENYIVGALVGVNLGGEIGGCRFEGSIIVNNSSVGVVDYELFYLGGLAGFSQGYQNYVGMIYGSSVDAYIEVSGGETTYAVGGIAGSLVGVDDAYAYVLNSKFDGTITGNALKIGGIVGYLREFSSVANCMSTGEAISNVSNITPQTSLFVAAAGGIVGIADNESAVTYCYSNMDLTTLQTAPAASVATRYDNCVGAALAENTQNYDYRMVATKVGTTETNSYSKGENINMAELRTRMGWAEQEWSNKTGTILPAGGNYTHVNYTVKVDFNGHTVQNQDDSTGDTQDYQDYNAEISHGYAQVYDLFYADGLNSLIATDGYVSYGFFFDQECTQRVPAAMVLTKPMTLYVGFADYSNWLDKTYYGTIEQRDNDGNPTGVTTDVEFIFGEDGYKGRLTVRVGANVSYYMYVYNGVEVVIYDINLNQYAFNVSNYSTETNEGARQDSRGNLVISDGFWLGVNDGALAPAVVCVPSTDAIGTWFATDGIYTLNGNRKGTFESLSGDVSNIEYTVDTTNGTKVTIIRGNQNIVGTVNGDQITLENGGELLKRSDEYRGVWVSDYNNRKTIEFDGKGGVKLEGNDYTYSVDETGRELTFSAGAASYSVKFNADGFLEVTVNGFATVYGREGSMTGMWVDMYYDYWLDFEPIGRNGYGYAMDSEGYTYIYGDGDALYDYTLYNNGRIAGQGYVGWTSPQGENKQMNRPDNGNYVPWLRASLPTELGIMVSDAELALIDPIEGLWNGSNGDTYEFNGLGFYDVNVGDDYLPILIQGSVTINGYEVLPVVYNYDFNNGTASFTYYTVNADNVTYNVVLTADGITVNGVVCKRPDAISEYKYYAGDLVIEFNGKSNLGDSADEKAKAIATVTDGQGTKTTYDYTSDGFNATLKQDGVEKYQFVYSNEGDKETCVLVEVGSDTRTPVGICSSMAGKEYIIGTGVYLNIGKFDFEGIAEATLVTGESEIDFDAVYVTDRITALYIGNSIAMFVQYQDEYTVSLFDAETSKFMSSGCVEDGFQGTYTAVEPQCEITSIVLDGRSHDSVYFGIAVFTMSDGEQITYACEWQGGQFVIGDVYPQGENMVPVYIASLEPMDGAMQFKTQENKILYLKEVE